MRRENYSPCLPLVSQLKILGMTEQTMRGLCPLITPRKEKNIKAKYKKINTTRRKRPPCPSLLSASIRSPQYLKA